MDFSAKIFIYNSFIKWSRASSKTKVHHFGLQRSGTNLLALKLHMMGVMVLNIVDPNRKSVKHKHFRIQSNKASISNKLYYNEENICSFYEVLDRMGYKDSVRFVGVYKNPVSWLGSMHRWEFKKEEISNAEVEYFNDCLLSDWISYYRAWLFFANEKPDRVKLLDIDDIISDVVSEEKYSQLFYWLTGKHVGSKKIKKLVNSVGRVPHSGRRKGLVVSKDYLSQLCELQCSKILLSECLSLYEDLKKL